MKHIAILILLASSICAAIGPIAERPNTVLIHPGETLYATFEQTGNTLAFVNVSKETNEAAQLVLTMHPFDKKGNLSMLEVKSKFKKDMHYRAEMRLLKDNRRADTSVLPVMAEKMSFESWPYPIDELALYGFELMQ